MLFQKSKKFQIVDEKKQKLWIVAEKGKSCKVLTIGTSRVPYLSISNNAFVTAQQQCTN